MSKLSVKLSLVFVGAAAFLSATTAEAATPITPLPTGADIEHVAQGCGPGRWRGPAGYCNGPGYGYGYHPYAYGYHAYGYHPYAYGYHPYHPYHPYYHY